jgi:hypothetical protein
MKNILLIVATLTVIQVCNAQLNFIDNGQQINNIDGRGVALGDFNFDGFPDAFVANNNAAKNIQIYLNDGNGQFTINGQNLVTYDLWWDTPAIGDLNNNDTLEVITGKTVWLNDGTGQFTADTSIIDYSEPEGIAITKLADFNHDGYLDMFAIVGYASSRVFLNDGSGHLINTGQHLGDGEIGTGQIAQIALGDINNDGHIDAITAGWKWQSTQTPNTVWLNDGLGNFHKDSGRNLDIGDSHIHGLTLGDLNYDGWLDLVMGIQDASRSGRVYLNDGTGKYITGTNLGMSNGEKSVLEDFDKDGDLDIFIATVFSSNGKIWLNDGKGNFQADNINFGKAWDVATADLNNDDRPDLFTVGFNWNGSSATPQPAKVWLNNTFVCDYFGQTPPGDSAIIFAPGIVSNANSHNRLIISPDGKEIFWNVVTDYSTGDAKIYSSKYSAGAWTDPAIPSFSIEWVVPHVLFSPDGQKLFFEYRENINSNDWHINYVVRTDTGWSEPKNDGFLFQLSSSFTTTGKVYYSDEMANMPWGNGIYAAEYTAAGLSNIQALAEEINATNIINYGSYISSDESFLLFSSNRPVTGEYDSNLHIYISFNDNGTWSTPQNIHSAIHFTGKARLPFISPDGKYLFFCGDDNNYYWVNINALNSLSPVDIKSIKMINSEILTFPNPTTQTIQIKGIDMLLNKANYTLTDLNGKTIKQGRLDAETIDISGLYKGIYMLSLHTSEEKITKKIVIE